MNKIIMLLLVFTLMGCRSKKKLIETELVGAKIERIAQVETKVEKKVISDSVLLKKKAEEKKEQTTNIKVEFDPKKNDSLEVNYQVGEDSLRLKISGNGKVSFDYKTTKKQVISEIKEIFGSKTLYNIDSTLRSESKTAAKTESKKITKDVTEKGFSFPIYLIIGGAVLLMIVLFWLFGKPKK